MAVAFQSCGTIVSTSGTTAAIPVPSGVTSGDLIVVLLYGESNTAGDGVKTEGDGGGSAAWTRKVRVDNGSGSGRNKCEIWWKRATGSDTGTYTFTQSSATWSAGLAARFSGAATTDDPFNAYGSGTSQATNALPDVTMDVTCTDYLPISMVGSYDGGSYSAPSGWTVRSGGSQSIGLITWTAGQQSSPATVAYTDGTYGVSTGTQDLTNFILAIRSTTSATSFVPPLAVPAAVRHRRP